MWKDNFVNPVVKKFEYGGQTVTLETGRIARQATAAVLVAVGKTQVLCTVVAAKEAVEGQGFFPLSVHYQEKTYAVGKIPGGFFKREGRPSEKEVLTSRLIDHTNQASARMMVMLVVSEMTLQFVDICCQ